MTRHKPTTLTDIRFVWYFSASVEKEVGDLTYNEYPSGAASYNNYEFKPFVNLLRLFLLFGFVELIQSESAGGQFVD